jgi:two-component system, OmpR family, sensor kinase
VSGLPIRIRVTLVFAAAMAILLAAIGLFLYLQLESSLDESVDETLEARAADLENAGRSEAGLRDSPRAGSMLLFAQEDNFSELLTADGELIATSRPDDAAAIDGETVSAARAARTESELEGLSGIEGRARVLAFPVETNDRRLIGVVGASLEDRDEALASLAALLTVGLPVALALASLAGYLALGAALRPVEAMRRRAAEIYDASAAERLPVPVADDELRRLGETLNGMLARLEAGLERERRFVDDASHELRTPLTLHKTELELALRHAEGEDELRAAIASALEEVDRLTQLAEDLLVVARTGEDGLALKPESVAVGELLASVADRFATRAREAGRAITVEPVVPAEVAVDADPARLEQALTNLVDNAVRHGEGEVRLSARADRGRVVIHVTDRGEGFPPGFAERAFERFTRADSARPRGGTGLGLAIVATIAEAHRGAAGAGSLDGGGADVWIELPVTGPG